MLRYLYLFLLVHARERGRTSILAGRSRVKPKNSENEFSTKVTVNEQMAELDKILESYDK